MDKAKSKKHESRRPKPAQTNPATDELDYWDNAHPNNVEMPQYRAARKALNILVYRAHQGDRNAARLLWRIAHDLVGWMNCSKTPGGELIRGLAPEYELWPVLASDHPTAMKELNAEVKRLRIGYATGIRSDSGARWGMNWDKLHGVTVAIIHGIRQLQQRLRHCAHAAKQGKKIDYSKLSEWEKQCEYLSPLTKDTFPQWKPIIRAAINSRRLEYLDEPELREVGKRRGGHRGTTEACIFDGIKQAILQTAYQLADK